MFRAAAIYGELGPWGRAMVEELGELMQRPVRVTSVSRRYGDPEAKSLYWCASGPGVRD